MTPLVQLLLLTVPTQASIPSTQTTAISDLRCGQYCLFVSLRSLDIEVPDVDALESFLGQPSPVGYSMKQLSDAAEARGAYTLGIDTSLTNLQGRPGRFACIALLEETGHFVCIYDIDDKNVYIIDPPSDRLVSRDAFDKLWSGKALLISKQPISPNVRPRFTLWLILGVAIGASSIVAAGVIKRWTRR